MRPSQPQQEPPFSLASRSLRFRVLFGDDLGFAVTHRVGIGGAVFKASIVPPVGSRVRLVERYAAAGSDGHIEAEVIAVIPEPTLDGAEPGFCAVFQRFTVHGSKEHLLDFLYQLDPGYVSARRYGAGDFGEEVFEAVQDPLRGACTRFSPTLPFARAPILQAAGLAESQTDSWDEGLEEIDLGIVLAVPTTPPAVAGAAAPPKPAPPATQPAAAPDIAPRKRGFSALLGSLFRRGRGDS